jgi:hypothetical protein
MTFVPSTSATGPRAQRVGRFRAGTAGAPHAPNVGALSVREITDSVIVLPRDIPLATQAGATQAGATMTPFSVGRAVSLHFLYGAGPNPYGAFTCRTDTESGSPCPAPLAAL